MRLTNYKTVRIIPGVYYFSIVFFFLVVFLNIQLDHTLFPSKKYYYLFSGGIVLALIYTYFGGKYFEYDSEGEIVTFINRGVILSNFFNYRDTVLEVKRKRIVDFKIINFLIYKRLVITVKTRHGLVKRHTNITFLSPKKTKYLSQSLNKLVTKNQDKKEN
ncbi:MAG: hypothetical protein ACQESK_05150 [Bacteroidota bacterium]